MRPAGRRGGMRWERWGIGTAGLAVASK
jgi:hypothetical protein